MNALKLCGAVAMAAALAAVACNRDRPRPGSAADADAAVAAWRAKHEADYRRDWATIAGLHPLKAGINTAGSAAANDIVLPPPAPPVIGRFVLGGANVRFEPAPDARVLLSNAGAEAAPIGGPIDLRDDSTRERDELVVGEIRLVVHRSGEHRGIRVRDPNGPLARSFAGFTWFPIDAGWRVVGRLIRDAQPQRLQVVNTYGDVDSYESEGVVEFTLLGRTLRLRPFTTRPGRFYFVFSDQSSGQETTRRRGSCTPTCATTAPPCSTSIRPTTRRARSTRTPPVRSRCAKTACR